MKSKKSKYSLYQRVKHTIPHYFFNVGCLPRATFRVRGQASRTDILRLAVAKPSNIATTGPSPAATLPPQLRSFDIAGYSPAASLSKVGGWPGLSNREQEKSYKLKRD